ncbi:MAG: hypothetical protein JWR26_2975 [Pedosphaera sp.]|nr:hypothetical protein [Pedosphaera sp.]
MHKILTTILFITGLNITASRSFGQGQVSVQNNTQLSPVTYGSGPNAGGRIFGPAGAFEYGFYIGAAGATSLAQMTLIDTAQNFITTSSTSVFAGQIAMGTITGQGNVGAANGFAGLNPETTYSCMVGVWTKADGADYVTASMSGDTAGWLGLSTIGSFTATLQGGPQPPAQAFGPFPGQLGAIILTPAPEPTTLALGALGTAALLLARRRKK